MGSHHRPATRRANVPVAVADCAQVRDVAHQYAFGGAGLRTLTSDLWGDLPLYHKGRYYGRNEVGRHQRQMEVQ